MARGLKHAFLASVRPQSARVSCSSHMVYSKLKPPLQQEQRNQECGLPVKVNHFHLPGDLAVGGIGMGTKELFAAVTTVSSHE